MTPATGSGTFLSRDGTFVVELDRFSGPMDLLLHLIRQQDLDVFDIPIARITDQFLEVVRGMEVHDLDQAGEFLEMAATLIRIKAKMLLPRREEEEEEDPRAELVRRLLEYEQIREVARHLSAAEADRSRRFRKGYLEARERVLPLDTPLETTWEEVFQAALAVTAPAPADRRHRVTPRTVAMEDKITLILQTLEASARVEFSRLLRPWKDRMHGVMTFLAGLELSRRHRVLLRQVRPFTELWIYRRDPDGGPTTGGPPPPGAGGG